MTSRKSGDVYVELSVNFPDDDKILGAGERAELLYVHALCFAQRLLSDGFIADAQLATFRLPGVKGRAAALVKAGLWIRDDTRGGYTIAAWGKRNRSRAEVEHISDAKRRAAEETNHKRWCATEPRPDCRICEEQRQAASLERSVERPGSESLERSLSESPSTSTSTATPSSTGIPSSARESENEHRLRQLLRFDPSPGQLRALGSFESELGIEAVGAVLADLLEQAIPVEADGYGMVREALRLASARKREGQRGRRPSNGRARGATEDYDAAVQVDVA